MIEVYFDEVCCQWSDGFGAGPDEDVEIDDDPDMGEMEVSFEAEANGVQVKSGSFGRGMFCLELRGEKEKVDLFRTVLDKLCDENGRCYEANLKVVCDENWFQAFVKDGSHLAKKED